MITVDLITGFLGSGKTTFMKRYVRYLMDCGEKVCILENDYGAVNIDTMLLGELYKGGCGMEAVAGACDRDCHQRRFKTKLIAMAMSGYSRVVIEPSGVFDVDEFFDTLREPPLDKWYEIGSVISIVDPTMTINGSGAAEYLLGSMAAVAGKIVLSHSEDSTDEQKRLMIRRIKDAMSAIRCFRDPSDYCIDEPWDKIGQDTWREIAHCGSRSADFVKLHAQSERFSSVYYMNLDPDPEQLHDTAQKVLSDRSCGGVLRVKGFTLKDGKWYELNAAHGTIDLKPITTGQSVIIVIGEDLCKSRIDKYFEIYKTEDLT